jgi:hypothetical protein
MRGKAFIFSALKEEKSQKRRKQLRNVRKFCEEFCILLMYNLRLTSGRKAGFIWLLV